MRKPRSDATLRNLPEDHYESLIDWLLAGTPYRVVKKRLADEFKVKTSQAALSGFWESECSAALLARRRKAVSVADEVAEAAAAEPGKFDAATIDALKQKAFELAINPNADPRDVKGLFMLVLKARDQSISEREIELAEKRFQRDTCELFLKWYADKRAKEIANAKGIGTNEKVDRLGKLIFGEDW